MVFVSFIFVLFNLFVLFIFNEVISLGDILSKTIYCLRHVPICTFTNYFNDIFKKTTLVFCSFFIRECLFKDKLQHHAKLHICNVMRA